MILISLEFIGEHGGDKEFVAKLVIMGCEEAVEEIKEYIYIYIILIA